MFRLMSVFTLCFAACAPYELDPVLSAEAMPPHADQVHCDSTAAFAAVVARHHVTREETSDLDESVSKASDLMSRHPGLLHDILSVAHCDTTTPTDDIAHSEQLILTYVAALAASAAPTVDAGRSLWLLGEHQRAGSLTNTASGMALQEEALRRVLGPALAALPADARAAAIADLNTPLDLVALADHEEELVDQRPPPLPTSTASEWVHDVRCRLALPGLLDDLRALNDLPPAERAAAWPAQHEDHADCTQYRQITNALDRDVRLLRELEGA